MIKAACHCSTVRFELAEAPQWVLDCNCSICRRYGALWSYYPGAAQAQLLRVPDAAATTHYLWGDRSIAFHRCGQCGCVTHMVAVDVDPPVIYGINARMMVGLDPATVVIRQIDNAHTARFWTRADGEMIAGHHAPMSASDDEWR